MEHSNTSSSNDFEDQRPNIKSECISSVVHGYDDRGYGIGHCSRSDGFTFTARMFATIDGENVSIQEVVKSKLGKGFRDALHVIVEKKSAARVEARCLHFGTCGGCVWQHIDVSHQKNIKEDFVFRLFRESLKHSHESVEFLPIIGAGSEEAPGMTSWAYRNKMEFSFSQDRSGKRFLGLYDRLGRGVVSLQECHLVSPWMAKAVRVVMEWWETQSPHLMAFRPRSGEGTLRTLTLREGLTSGDRMIILTVSSKPEFAPTKQDLHSFEDMMKTHLMPEASGSGESQPHLSLVLRIHQAIPKMPTQIYEMILCGPDYIRETVQANVTHQKKVSLTFHISPQAFFQPNTGAFTSIYSQALLMAELSPTDTVYDLYCGTGTFGMFAAHQVHKVIAIELSKDAAYDAKTNSQRLGITNFHIHCGDVGSVLKNLQEEDGGGEEESIRSEKNPVVIIDPPRSGLNAVAIDEILSLSPKKIVYVSCNPVNQVRDIEEILRREKYRLKTIRPIDQFPHTPHVENIAVLERQETV